MITPEQKARAQADYDAAKTRFITQMGLGPQDSVDDWIREGLAQLKLVNTNIQGDILARVSLQTKTLALNSILEHYGK